jgi:uncharacterized Zn finger protein
LARWQRTNGSCCLLVGYVSNQLSMLQKLLTFATNRPAKEVEQHGTGAQTQMLVRLTVGALNEAWELVRTRFIETTMAKDYLNLLDASGQEAFATLKRQFGESNLLSKIRKLCVSLPAQRRRGEGVRVDLQ